MFAALALALAPACKKEEPPSPAAERSGPDVGGGGGPSEAAPEAKEDPDGASATPASPAAEPSVAIDPLLDLVSAGAEAYVIVRAPHELLDGYARVVEGQGPVWTKLLDARKDPAKPGADAGLRKLLIELPSLRAEIGKSRVHLERGLVITGDQAVTVLAADDAEAVPALMRAISARPEDVKATCKALTEPAGFVACADDPGALEAYEPGRRGAALHAALEGLLDPATLEGANVLAQVGEGAEAMAIAGSATAGVLQVDVRPPASMRTEAFELMAPGSAAALGLVAPGSSFVWMRMNATRLTALAPGAPPAVGNMLQGLSGEVLLAGIGSVPGAVALFGLSDPTAIAGLVPLAALARDDVPKTLPDGSGLEVVIEDVEDGKGGKVQVLRAKISPVGELAAIREQLALQPEVVAFVTDAWAAIGLGTGPGLVPEVARASASAPTPELLAALPPSLARVLSDERATSVTHLELDGLHGPGVREGLVEALTKAAVPGAAPVSADNIEVVFALLSPLSSISAWTSGDAANARVHVAMRGFGDATSAEGKAAHAARLEVDAGRKEAATAYGELVAAHGSSSRIAAYRARAGQGPVGAAQGAAAMVGLLAAIAVPAFDKYMERSKQAAQPAP